jgi:MFS family permease
MPSWTSHSPRRGHPAFAGWLMLLVAGFAVFWSGPAQTYGVSAFVDPMLDDLGWSRSLFSSLYSIGTLTSAGILILAGRQIDRWGNRAVMTTAAALFGLAMLLLSTAGHAIALLIGFSLLRSFGSGVLTLGARTLVPYWFQSRTGRAFSILGVAAMLSSALIPPFNNLVINAVGWRDAWRVNAAIIWVVVLPAMLILIRNRPQDIGQFPDGRRSGSDEPHAASAPEWGLTVREALRTYSFWGLVGASVVPSLVVTGLAFNQVAILTDKGMASSLAATTFTVEAAVAMPTTMLAGWIVDRYPVRFTLAAGQVCLAIAMLVLLAANTPSLALIYSVWRGASSGLWTVAADVAWPSYFGRRHLGSIRSVGFAVGVVGAAIGPLPFGLAYDLLGGYNPAIAALLVLPVAACVAVLLTKPPGTGPAWS